MVETLINNFYPKISQFFRPNTRLVVNSLLHSRSMCLHYICYYCPIVGFLSYYKIFNKLIYTHNNNPKLGSIYFLSLLRVIRAEDYDNIYIGGWGKQQQQPPHLMRAYKDFLSDYHSQGFCIRYVLLLMAKFIFDVSRTLLTKKDKMFYYIFGASVVPFIYLILSSPVKISWGMKK